MRVQNRSVATWPEGLKAQTRLVSAFDTHVVYGREAILKPHARIFTFVVSARVGFADVSFDLYPSEIMGPVRLWA